MIYDTGVGEVIVFGFLHVGTAGWLCLGQAGVGAKVSKYPRVTFEDISTCVWLEPSSCGCSAVMGEFHFSRVFFSVGFGCCVHHTSVLFIRMEYRMSGQSLPVCT